MKYYKNGQGSGSLTPLWPMMRGYGLDPTEVENQQHPTAGAGGEYESSWDSSVQWTDPADEPTMAEMVESIQHGTETMDQQLDVLTQMLDDTQVPPEMKEEPEEALPHPYEEGTSEGVPESTSGGVPGTTSQPTSGEYVGGTEVGPEASGQETYTEATAEKSRWPLYVGLGAGVLGLGAIVAVVVANK